MPRTRINKGLSKDVQKYKGENHKVSSLALSLQTSVSICKDGQRRLDYCAL